ncbi:hypothetical protein HYH03_004309 [Edaphochlamys debaryana]|uniref:Uncharacterized protein n=1 Tax=Edaphochlamys debaryana TaxID=47281 RepID=A0A836C390_9CHLO|nr:hypothetical protein HYH03_004309 [Edaphochlamys debaryana]|eukprot:KAG2497563.1 hypothetical protein HYH03_004309 [Edaphochlamys debaryana]
MAVGPNCGDEGARRRAYAAAREAQQAAAAGVGAGPEWAAGAGAVAPEENGTGFGSGWQDDATDDEGGEAAGSPSGPADGGSGRGCGTGAVHGGGPSSERPLAADTGFAVRPALSTPHLMPLAALGGSSGGGGSCTGGGAARTGGGGAVGGHGAQAQADTRRQLLGGCGQGVGPPVSYTEPFASPDHHYRSPWTARAAATAAASAATGSTAVAAASAAALAPAAASPGAAWAAGGGASSRALSAPMGPSRRATAHTWAALPAFPSPFAVAAAPGLLHALASAPAAGTGGTGTGSAAGLSRRHSPLRPCSAPQQPWLGPWGLDGGDLAATEKPPALGGLSGASTGCQGCSTAAPTAPPGQPGSQAAAGGPPGPHLGLAWAPGGSALNNDHSAPASIAFGGSFLGRDAAGVSLDGGGGTAGRPHGAGGGGRSFSPSPPSTELAAATAAAATWPQWPSLLTQQPAHELGLPWPALAPEATAWAWLPGATSAPQPLFTLDAPSASLLAPGLPPPSGLPRPSSGPAAGGLTLGCSPWVAAASFAAAAAAAVGPPPPGALPPPQHLYGMLMTLPGQMERRPVAAAAPLAALSLLPDAAMEDEDEPPSFEALMLDTW